MNRRRRRGRHDDDGFESHDMEHGGLARHASFPFQDALSRKEDRKTEQLCRQVERRLSLALGELEDPVLHDVRIEAVGPGNGGELLVFVSLPEGQEARIVLRALRVVRGRLRSEIAEAIHRKRTPQLVFSVVSPEEDEQ